MKFSITTVSTLYSDSGWIEKVEISAQAVRYFKGCATLQGVGFSLKYAILTQKGGLEEDSISILRAAEGK